MDVKQELLSYSTHPSNPNLTLVGIESRLEDLNFYMSVELEDVRIVGICGMGGIGKTTLARTYFDRMHSQFDGAAFLANVREVSSKEGLLPIQERLMSQILKGKRVKIWNAHNGVDTIRRRLRSKRVLIVIDDVDQLNQLQHLAGGTDWFGLGSRVIITSRDQHLLTCHGVENIYQAKGLYRDEALELLSLKAFHRNYPPESYMNLSEKVVYYADGLPLAVEVLGAFLFGKTLDQWRIVLEGMQKENPEKKIFDTLKLSFDGLEETEKQIFLDIAFFLKGKKIDRAKRIMESCDFYPDIGIRVLIDKCLITINYEKLQMHDLLQEMGRKIVWQESPDEPGKRSRLWLYEDMFHICTRNTGTGDVEGIAVESPDASRGALSAEAFVKLRKLRLLQLRNVHFSANLSYLSNELRYLKWNGYPHKDFPGSFQSKKLVEMTLYHGQAEQLWKGIKQFNNLRIMKLSHCERLVKTPDFRGSPNVEKLDIEGCVGLQEIDQSIGVLQKLVLLKIKDCTSLETLPTSIYDLKALKILNLSGCSGLNYLLEELGCLECLEELDLSRTEINQSPASASAFALSLFKNIKTLSMSGCKVRQLPPETESLPLVSSLVRWGLCSLLSLDLSNCDLKEEMVPKELGCFSSLGLLNLSNNSFSSLPANVNTLPMLQFL